MIKTVLFDLDGTLLPMDLDIFTKAYIGSLSATLSGGEGDVAKKISEGTMAGVYAMVKNDGQKTNEEVFWERFDKFLPAKQYRDSKEIEHYYSVEFQKVKEVCSFTPKAAEIVKKAKELSFKVVAPREFSIEMLKPYTTVLCKRSLPLGLPIMPKVVVFLK